MVKTAMVCSDLSGYAGSLNFTLRPSEDSSHCRYVHYCNDQRLLESMESYRWEAGTYGGGCKEGEKELGSH